MWGRMASCGPVGNRLVPERNSVCLGARPLPSGFGSQLVLTYYGNGCFH